MPDSILISGIGILFAGLAWWRFRDAIGLLLILLPVYLLRFTILSLPMTVLEVLILIVIAIYVIRVFKKDLPRPIIPWRFLIFFFLLVGAVAVLLSPDARQALGLYKAYILEPILLFVVLTNTLNDQRGVRLMIWALGVATVLIGFVTVLQALHVVPIPGDYGIASPPRATSVFPFPTAVGKFVGPIVALFLALLFVRTPGGHARRSRAELLFMSGVVLFGALACILSISRGAIFGIFIAAAFSALFAYKRKLIFGLLAAGIFVALLIPGIRSNVMDVVRGTDTSTDVHVVMWKGALRIIADHPVAGTGLASFPIVYDVYRDPAHVELFPNPDQFLLTIWIELGFAGLLVFAWAFGQYAVACRRAFTAHKPLAVGLLAAFIALLVHGMVDTPYFKNDLAVIFWALMACAAILETRARDSVQ